MIDMTPRKQKPKNNNNNNDNNQNNVTPKRIGPQKPHQAQTETKKQKQAALKRRVSWGATIGLKEKKLKFSKHLKHLFF